MSERLLPSDLLDEELAAVLAAAAKGPLVAPEVRPFLEEAAARMGRPVPRDAAFEATLRGIRRTRGLPDA